MSNVIERIITERQKQIDLGYTPEHDDDEHQNQELADAAAAYCFGGTILKTNQFGKTVEIAPTWLTDWEIKRKPRIRQLEIAAAFIIAEIERLERKGKNEQRKSTKNGGAYRNRAAEQI